MRRLLSLTRRSLIPLVLAIGVLASADAAAARDAYCTPTGDFCTSLTKIHGVRTIRLTTFSFRGYVRVCITHRQRTDCRRFRLARLPDTPSLYEFKVQWRRHFPYRGPGRYFVRFSQSGFPIGRTLDFRA